MNVGILDPQLLFFSDEAWFHLHRRVNFQINGYWSSLNPKLVPNVGVWCATSANRITGPTFSEKSSIRTNTLIAFLISFPSQNTQEERLFFFDRAKAHTDLNPLSSRFDVLGDIVISERLWPALSPDFTPCDIYL
jgi:hypothetical protein